MKKLSLYLLIFGAILINLFFSMYLFLSSLFVKSSICFEGVSCEIVRTFAYASLFGIKISAIGILFFILLMTLFLLTYYYENISKKVFILISSIGSLFSIYLLYREFFLIKMLCVSCLIVNILTLVILFLSIFDYFHYKN